MNEAAWASTQRSTPLVQELSTHCGASKRLPACLPREGQVSSHRERLARGAIADVCSHLGDEKTTFMVGLDLAFCLEGLHKLGGRGLWREVSCPKLQDLCCFIYEM